MFTYHVKTCFLRGNGYADLPPLRQATPKPQWRPQGSAAQALEDREGTLALEKTDFYGDLVGILLVF